VPSKPSLNVSLTPQLDHFIAKLVASGRYQSASEVVRAGLRLLEKFEIGNRPSGMSDGDAPSSGRASQVAGGRRNLRNVMKKDTELKSLATGHDDD
jgi:antitoxin ParD1/3/4